ncbi:MAG: AraC family transcriptional regulator [Firmicutes bacterium]|nr:AraC family transcriptional regulator [Bacillota bacterium]
MHETIYGFPVVEEHHFFQITICGISYCDGSYRIERRNSEVCTLEYILQGTGEIQLPDGSRIYPSKGDVYLLHQGEDHLYRSDSSDPWEKIWCNVSGNFVEQMIRMYHLEHVHWIPQCCIEPQMRRFLEIAADPSLSRTEIWEKEELLFHQILQILSRCISTSDQPVPKQMQLLQEYLDRSLNRPFSMDQLSQIASLSPSQINRLFKQTFQTTPYEYLLTRKLSVAKEMLYSTRLSVKEIAYALGFGDEHYFSTFFRKRTGMTPLSYRRSKQN